MRPRLLILTPDFPPAHGGVQVLVQRLASAIVSFDTQVLALDGPGASACDAASTLAIRRCGRRARGTRARALVLNTEAVRSALRLRPDVILSAHVVASPGAALARALTGARTAQYFYAVEVVGKPRLAAFAAARADVSIAISEHTASLLAAAGAASSRVRVIPPGVDPADPGALRDAAASDRGDARADRPTILTVASLMYSYKGHDVMIDALQEVRRRVPRTEWVVIGEGRLRGRIEAAARERGLSASVRFLGAVGEEVRNGWLARADVFAMPSRCDGEGFGIAYLEAGAYGKPVVAGDAGGAREAVADGVNGLLVDPLDARAVASAITRLLLDGELARRLGAGGERRAAQLAWPSVAKNVEAELLKLLPRST